MEEKAVHGARHVLEDVNETMHMHGHDHTGAHTHTQEDISNNIYDDIDNHTHDDGRVHNHVHDHHAHSHSHVHSHAHTKAVLNRLSRIVGHLESIKRMVADDRDCSEVLIQLAAVNSAVKGVSRVIMKDHIEHCIVEAVKMDDHEKIEQLNNAIDRFIK